MGMYTTVDLANVAWKLFDEMPHGALVVLNMTKCHIRGRRTTRRRHYMSEAERTRRHYMSEAECLSDGIPVRRRGPRRWTRRCRSCRWPGRRVMPARCVRGTGGVEHDNQVRPVQCSTFFWLCLRVANVPMAMCSKNGCLANGSTSWMELVFLDLSSCT
jgi:hypothetical protein